MKYLLILLTFSLFACQNDNRKEQEKTVNHYFDEAYEYLSLGKSDSSYFLFEKAKAKFLDDGDSLGAAKCLVNMAITQREQGDLYGAQETSLEALKYLDTTEESYRIYVSSNYNNLASATHSLQDYSKAIELYNHAIAFSDDSLNSNIYRNNLALSYIHLQDYDSAVAILENVLKGVRSNPKQYARVLSNIAFFKWKRDLNYNPVPELSQAYTIRKKEKDKWGQNASLAHLADYYENTKPDSALYYARQQYSIAKTIKSANDMMKGLARLIKVGPRDSIVSYFNQYRHISDSTEQARAAAKNQFALIRYEVEKNKADNLRLEKENAEKQNRLVRQRVITGASVFLFLLAVGVGTLWYKRRKQRLELEAQNRIKETQLNLSKKVHDVVANDIYRVMTEVEYKDDLDREGLLDKLEVIYNQSRDISHNVEQQPTMVIPYNEQVSTLLRSFATDHLHVSIAGNDAKKWEDINNRIKNEVKYVLQELMVNMKKHSHAKQVVVRFEKSDQQLKIFYKDNGVGIPKERSKGKGLTNTVSRIEILGGEINFVSEPGKGLSFTANIPLI